MKKILTFQQHIMEAVKFENKVVWWVTKNHKTGFAKTNNDIAEEMMLDNLQDHEDIVTFDSADTDVEARRQAAQADKDIRSGKFKVKDDWKRYSNNMDEGLNEAETLLPDVSDDRIVAVWDAAIGGDRPAIAKMRKDILDLMKRDKISFTEMEIELDK